MHWNPTYSYASLPPDLKDPPSYYITLTTPVTPPDKGLARFKNVHIWNIKATGAKRAFDVSAYPAAPLEDFKIDHLNIEAQTAGTIANANNWTLTDNTISKPPTAARKVTLTQSTGEPNSPKDVPFGEPKESRNPVKPLNL